MKIKPTPQISNLLMEWHSTIDRRLPWKIDPSPYKIWLSEIIMQQTRVAQGTPYYLKFVKAYPIVEKLANAPEEEIMRLWQGLGYYSRARNLHFTAKIIRDKYKGVFPRRYEDILALKGVGKYTAAAIASFAYGDVLPVVDGNVIRVISRIFGITDPVDDPKTVKRIYQIAEDIISNEKPADHNQSIMDFGALHCTPKNPKCEACNLEELCSAKREDLVSQIPFKAKKLKKKKRYFHFFFIDSATDELYIQKRKGKDIWQNLYQLPLIEKPNKGEISENEINSLLSSDLQSDRFTLVRKSEQFKHVLSHQVLYTHFYTIRIRKLYKHPNFIIEKKEKLDQYGFPVLILKFLDSLD